VPAGPPPSPIATDPAIVAELIARTRESLAAVKLDIRTKSGTALLDFILADIQELKRILFDPQSHQVVMAGMEATWWLNDTLHAWLGEKNAADTLTQSVPNNVTSEMGLALLDVADVIRPHPAVVASCSMSRRTTSWTNCPRSRVAWKRETPFAPGSICTACARRRC
jgi:pyruvate,water dikinase